MYHLLKHAETLRFTCNVLCVSMILTVNINYFFEQHKLPGLCNGTVVCFL
jgi:hypothetical protein